MEKETKALIAKLRGTSIGFGFDPLVQQLADVIETLDKRVTTLENLPKVAPAVPAPKVVLPPPAPKTSKDDQADFTTNVG
jgi:hypothetical protein